MIRKLVWVVLVSGLASVSARAQRSDGGSTGHGPVERGFARELEAIQFQLRSRPDCRKYFPGGMDDEVLEAAPRFDRNLVFGDGASVIAGHFIPSSDGNIAADVACVVAANAGAPVPAIEECEEFATCLGL